MRSHFAIARARLFPFHVNESTESVKDIHTQRYRDHFVELRFLLPDGLSELKLTLMLFFLEESLIFSCHSFRGDVFLLDVNSFPLSLNRSLLLFVGFGFSFDHFPLLLGPSGLGL